MGMLKCWYIAFLRSRVYMYYQSYGRTEVNTRYKMPPKAVQLAQYTPSTEVGTVELARTQGNTSMAKSSNQSVEWYREIIT